jgi:hypothetical protein
MLTVRTTFLLTSLLATVLGLTACGSTHPAASHPARTHPAVSPTPAPSLPTTPELTADSAICKTFNANIGNGGEPQITQALVTAGTSISYKLRHDVTNALTGTTLQGELKDQVKVLVDCTLVKVGRVP